ncbi:MAG: D-2-hydroxyacid dehydrogenase [Verrucomicrobiota bacterium]
MHSIVVLDGYTLNPGDLSWENLNSLGTLQVYDRTAEQKIISQAKEATILLTNKTPLSASTLQQLPHVKFIGVLATGYNIVDITAARRLGISVANVPSYSADSVAQLTWGLLLELTHHVALHSETVRKGEWSTSTDFCYWKTPLIELAGLTIGIIGLGTIGQKVARIAHAFGMTIQSVQRSKKIELPFPVKFTDLETLLRTSDVVSLHSPLTPETEKIINSQTLSWMKSSAFLLNTSRGGLIDSSALAQALHQGKIAGAGLDVLESEPPRADHPLLTAPHCLITPHLAWATLAARQKLMNQTVENVRSFIAGKPIHIVN